MKHIRSAHSAEPVETGRTINYASFSKITQAVAGKAVSGVDMRPMTEPTARQITRSVKSVGIKGTLQGCAGKLRPRRAMEVNEGKFRNLNH